MINLSQYREQLAVIAKDPNARVMGSVGRIAIADIVTGDPYAEFRLRGESATGRLSDIDVLGASPETIRSARQCGRIAVDTRAFDDTDVSVTREKDGRWWLMNSATYRRWPIDPSLMAPVSQVVQGVEIVTVPLVTHKLLHTLRRRKEQKDVATNVALDMWIADASNQGAFPNLTIEQTGAFWELSRLLMGLSASEPTDRRHSE